MQLSVIFRRNRRAGPSILSVAATIDGAWLLARIAAIDAEARERSWW
ncbi:MAG TPA: hypothetical protein VFP05_07865 [Thermomicrobiales bacterium]|nr:hypothetical protein [Thermomicrobiales bacterium]